MSDLSVHNTFTVPGFSLQRLRAAVAQFRRRRAAFNQTWRELDLLTDRELSELGLSRCDIPRVARSAADMV